MPSTNGGHYDEALLAAAPKATKSQLQEGYNPDLLNESANPPPRDIESGHASKEYLGTQPMPLPAKVPFWRTTKGMIIIAVAAIVVIGAVVGGAVGGTVGKNKNNSSDSGSLDAGSTAGSGQQGANPAQQTSTPTTVSEPQSTGQSEQTSSGDAGGGGGGPAAGSSTNSGNTGSTGGTSSTSNNGNAGGNAGSGNPFDPPPSGGNTNVEDNGALTGISAAIPGSPPTVPPVAPPDSFLGVGSLS